MVAKFHSESKLLGFIINFSFSQQMVLYLLSVIGMSWLSLPLHIQRNGLGGALAVGQKWNITPPLRNCLGGVLLWVQY